jgi:hypothetical protein
MERIEEGARSARHGRCGCCGHDIVLDDADAFARETGRALQGT